MYGQVYPSDVAAGGCAPPLAPVATQYYQQIIHSVSSKNLSARDQREFKTLGVCLDLIAKGKISQVGDVLMQRFKSLESPSAAVGEQQELIAPATASVSTQKEREVAAKQAHFQSKLEKRMGS